MKLHFMAHSEDEIHHFILFEPEVVTYTLKKNVFRFLPTSLFSPSGGFFYLKIPFLSHFSLECLFSAHLDSLDHLPVGQRGFPQLGLTSTCLKVKRLLLNNRPPAAIWADTLSRVILLDTKVSPEKRRVVKGTGGAMKEKMRMSSLHSCLCTFRKCSGESCVGARANSPRFFEQRSTHEASFHGSLRG